MKGFGDVGVAGRGSWKSLTLEGVSCSFVQVLGLWLYVFWILDPYYEQSLFHEYEDAQRRL